MDLYTVGLSRTDFGAGMSQREAAIQILVLEGVHGRCGSCVSHDCPEHERGEVRGSFSSEGEWLATCPRGPRVR